MKMQKASYFQTLSSEINDQEQNQSRQRNLYNGSIRSEVYSNSSKKELKNKKNIKKAVNSQIQIWQRNSLFDSNQKTEPYLWSLYEIMGECLEFLLKPSIEQSPQREKKQQYNQPVVKKIQLILAILMARELQLNSKTQIGVMESLIDSFKIIANQLYIQSYAANRNLSSIIVTGEEEQVKKAILTRIAFIHFNEFENQSIFSDESFNPTQRCQNAIKKADKTHGLSWFLKLDHVYVMRKRLQSIPNEMVRQNLIRNIQYELIQHSSQLQMMNKEWEVLEINIPNETITSQQVDKNGKAQNKQMCLQKQCQKTEARANLSNNQINYQKLQSTLNAQNK